jgi:hypothetical protein
VSATLLTKALSLRLGAHESGILPSYSPTSRLGEEGSSWASLFRLALTHGNEVLFQ